jgi:hypothetical protein
MSNIVFIVLIKHSDVSLGQARVGSIGLNCVVGERTEKFHSFLLLNFLFFVLKHDGICLFSSNDWNLCPYVWAESSGDLPDGDGWIRPATSAHVGFDSGGKFHAF